MSKRIRVWRLLVGAGILALTGGGVAFAAAPSPPLMVCLDGSNCAAALSGGSQSQSSAATRGIKWHPGIYIYPGNNRCDSRTQSDDFATIDQIANVSQVKGIYVRWEWSCYEGDTAGDYSPGFARIDAYLEKLAASGKRLMISLWPMHYGTCSSSNSRNGVPNDVRLPAYLLRIPGSVNYCTSAYRLYTAALWNPAVVDRIIAMSKAYAERYDDHPLVEMWEPQEETAGMIGDTSAGFTWAAAQAQWKRMYLEFPKHWKRTMVRYGVNYMENNAAIREAYDTLARPGLIFGGPDTMPERVRQIPANYIFRGFNPGTKDAPQGTRNSAWPDLRGVHPWISEMHGGPIYGDATAQELQDYAYNTMRSNYIIWVKQTWDAVPARHWPVVLDMIRSGRSSVYSTACPRGWVCDTN